MAVLREGRATDEMRPVVIQPGVSAFAEGSVLISFGLTQVRCTASIEGRVPPFLLGKGSGWVTAEYSMLPRAGLTRSQRESVSGRIGGRTHEIQRLIGRSLRAVVDLAALGERSIVVDCDVLQADGGTRTAAITGGYVALALALRTLVTDGQLAQLPLRGAVAAVSVGVIGGEPRLDLEYIEDSAADVDANIVMTDAGEFVELQMTAEHATFGPDALARLLDLGRVGITHLLALQQQALAVPT